MKLKSLLIGLAAAFALSTATASASVRTYNCGGKFSRIKIETGVPVDYTVTAASHATIEAEGSDEYLQDLKVTVKNGELWIRIERKNGSININKQTLSRVTVSGPALEGIEASSGARFKSRSAFKLGNRKTFTISTSSGSDVELEGSLTCGTLSINSSSASKTDIERCTAANAVNIDASSGSSVDVECVTAKLSVTASSGSSVEAEGTADNAALEASSGAKIDAVDLVAKSMSAEASSGSSVKHSCKNATETKSSGASIKYKGRK